MRVRANIQAARRLSSLPHNAFADRGSSRLSRLPIAAAAALTLLAVPFLTFAQAGPADPGPSDERVNQVIVYGDDPCPKATSANEITVCARKEEGERYRIPEPLRGMDNPVNRAWTDRVLAYETVGKTGTLSCSPVGPGGFTGCTQNLIQNAYAEKKQTGGVKFSDLIEAERAKRLSTTDQDARETQARVEAEERAYEARQKGSMAEPDAAQAVTQAPPVAASDSANEAAN
jgi:hypothetical protein